MQFSRLHYYKRVFLSTCKPHRLWNMLKVEVSYLLSYFKITTKWNVMPVFASIEPTNICNLHCPECPVGMRTKQIKAIEIDVDLTERVIDQLAPTLTHLILYFQGEPLLSKNFIRITHYAHSKRILTSTSTNAQLLNDKLAKQIVESGLDRLIISMDGTTQDTYESYRIGGKLERAITAVESVVKWKKKLKSPSPFVEIQFLVLKSNEHQIKDMKKLSAKLGADKLTFKTAQLYDFENGNELLPSIEKYRRYELKEDGKYHIKSPLNNRCKRLWSGSVINSRGEVLPCCFDKDSTYVFGDLKQKSFQDCYQSNKANRFRKSLLENRQQFEMCRNCTSR